MKALLRAVLGSVAGTAGWWVADQLGLGTMGAFVLSTAAWAAGDLYAVRLHGEHF